MFHVKTHATISFFAFLFWQKTVSTKIFLLVHLIRVCCLLLFHLLLLLLLLLCSAKKKPLHEEGQERFKLLFKRGFTFSFLVEGHSSGFRHDGDG